MTRLLLDRSTGKLLPYPRQDNEPVVGLDRDAAYVVEVVREPEPDQYDPTTHYLQPLKPVVAITDSDSDDVNGTVTYGWELVAIMAPIPPPNFVAFNEALLTENGFEAVWNAVLNIKPMLATAMAAYLETFRISGDWSQYVISLDRAIALLETEAQRQYILGELLALSQRCHLPADFIAALQSLIQPLPE